MNLKNFIRAIVLKTNSVFPFNYLNKIPYHLAVRNFIKIFSPFKEIKSIYLRHGMSRKNWVPAVSDIDLTVIIDSNLSEKQEYDFLKSFWMKFEKLKKIFPMIGEVDILNENEIGTWTKFTIRGYETREWKLLYGEKIVKSNYKVDKTLLAVDSLNFAITNYLEYFLPKFYSDENSDFISSAELARLTNKILRYSGTSLEQKLPTGESELLYLVINGLESSIKSIELPVETNENIFKQEIFSIEPYTEDFKSESRKIDLTGLEAIKDKIDSFIISYTFRFIVLKENLTSEEEISCLQMIKDVFGRSDDKPIILTFMTFEYLLRIYNPFIYSQFLDARINLIGEDVFKKIKPPDSYYYKKSLLEETNNIFLFPYKKSLIQTKSIKNFIRNGFESEIRRGLFLKLYLEKSLIEPGYNNCLNECKKVFPHYIQKINELTKNYNTDDSNQLSFKTYNLLKTFSSEINNFLN